MKRLDLVACVALAVLMPSTSALGQSSEGQKSACVTAFGEAQKQRRAGKLIAAREQLLICAQSSCPSVLVGKCSEWLDEVDAALPSIVVRFRGSDGEQRTDVRVNIDGVQVRAELDGQQIVVDPGEHTVVLEAEGEAAVERTFVALEGQKAQLVDVQLGDGDSVSPDAGSALSPLVWAGFGVGGVGLVVGGLTGGLSLAKASTLEDGCPSKSACDPALESTRDHGELLAHVSTAGFAVAGAGIALGVIGLVVGGGSAADGADAAAHVGPERRGIELSPQLGPGYVGVRAQF